MEKYLSCPLCGTPEPETLRHANDNGCEIWIVKCFSCGRIIRIEDITEIYAETEDVTH